MSSPPPLGYAHASQVRQCLVEVFELNLVLLFAHGEFADSFQVRTEVTAIGGIGYQRDLWRAFLELHGRVREQVFDLDTQRDCPHCNRVNGWVGTAPFHTAHIRAGKAALVRKGFLGKTGDGTQFFDAGTEFLTNVNFVHAETVADRDKKGHALKVVALL